MTALATLGEICEFKYGKSLPSGARRSGDVPVFGSNGRVGRHDVALTTGPTIIVGRKGSLGEVHFSEEPSWPIDTTYYIDSTATDCNLKWLSHMLRAARLTDLNRAAAVPGLNRNDAYRIQIPLPPLEEQRRIAAILDKADALRQKRKQAIALLDSLTQSIFGHMFTDIVLPLTERKNSAVLEDVADIISGITKGRKIRSERVRTVPYLAVANVQDKFLDLRAVKNIEATEEEIDRYRLQQDDLLLTEGGDPDKLGRGTLWNSELPEAIHQNHIFRVRVKSSDIRPVFLSRLIASPLGRSYFLKSAKQTTGIASINKTQLSKFPVAFPPLEDQLRFETAVYKAHDCLHQAESGLRQLDSLFNSLQHRAFSGQL